MHKYTIKKNLDNMQYTASKLSKLIKPYKYIKLI